MAHLCPSSFAWCQIAGNIARAGLICFVSVVMIACSLVWSFFDFVRASIDSGVGGRWFCVPNRIHNLHNFRPWSIVRNVVSGAGKVRMFARTNVLKFGTDTKEDPTLCR